MVTATPLNIASNTSTTRSVFGNTSPVEPYTAQLVNGSDGYDNAIGMSKMDFPNGAGTVVIATGESYDLSASASVLAKAYSAPLLLTQGASLDAATATELQRLNPSTVFLVGLSDTIYYNVRDTLTNCTINNTTGANDNATAATIATDVKAKLGTVSEVIVVASDNPAAVLSVAPGAASKGWPVLLCPTNGPLPSETSSWYTSNMSTPAAVEVGTTVTLTGIQSQNVGQITGTSADDLNSTVAWWEYEYWGCNFQYTGVVDGTSTNWAKGMTMGAYLGRHNGILFLSDGENIASQMTSYMSWVYPVLKNVSYEGVVTPWTSEEACALWLPPAPRHTSYDLGSFADNSSTAGLDNASLNETT